MRAMEPELRVHREEAKVGKECISSSQSVQSVTVNRKRKGEDHHEGKYLQQKYFTDGLGFKY